MWGQAPYLTTREYTLTVVIGSMAVVLVVLAILAESAPSPEPHQSVPFMGGWLGIRSGSIARMDDSVRREWDAAAETFDQGPDHGMLDRVTRHAWWRTLEPLLPPSPSLVADLGCGTGTVSLLMSEHGHDVTGVDLSPQMIHRAPRSHLVVDASSGWFWVVETDLIQVEEGSRDLAAQHVFRVEAEADGGLPDARRSAQPQDRSVGALCRYGGLV